jgi:ssDNA-binding Zn-finger/Zn-ribbon topoisomerase 1
MFPPAKKEAAQEVDVPCPECGTSPMALRTGAETSSWGAKYPKCRGTQKITPEIAEKIRSSDRRAPAS